MKNSRKIISLILSLSLVMLLFCSCGGADKYYSEGNTADMAAAANGDFGWDDSYDLDAVEAPEEVAEEIVEAEAEYGAAASAPATESSRNSEKTSDKIIKNGNLNVETLEFDKFIKDLESAVSGFGGYIESSSVYGSVNNRSANYTVRVPADKYDAFVGKVGDLATVTFSDESVENVTLKYVDIEARLSSLKAERDSFMKLMDQAETIDEILQIQSYLTDVNYQIESYTSQFNALKDKVSYSTVSLSVNEVARITPETPKTVWERISVGIKESVYNVTEGAKDFFVGFVVATPYLAIYAVVIAIIVIVIVVIIKASNKRQKRKLEEMKKKQEENKQ